MIDTPDWSANDAAGLLREPTASDDKYSRGVIGVRTGSDAYPGAAVLGVEAAWRTGVGMVRYLGPARELVLRQRPETVTADGRVQAWLIGSGTDAETRAAAESDALRALLDAAEPVIVDAGALDLAAYGTAPRVITPHDREHARVRAALGLDREGLEEPESAGGPERAASALQTAGALGAVVVLKGARTIVATPSGWVRVVASGTAWLATAGTGDVLGGVLGAVVAGAAARRALTADDLGPLAATGVWLHGRAAELAALAAAPGTTAGGPITALDVARALPRAVGELLAAR